MSRLPQLGHNSIYYTLSPSPKAIAPKCSWTQCSSCYQFPSTTNSLQFFSFLHFSLFFQFPLLAISLLLSRHFPHFSISLPFLLGPCCPQGVWDSLGDSLYVPLSWPELPSWGSFDGVGDYSSCSLGRTPLSHSTSNSITCTYRHTHTGTLSKNNYTKIFRNFYHWHTLMLKALLSRYCKIMMHCWFLLLYLTLDIHISSNLSLAC